MNKIDKIKSLPLRVENISSILSGCEPVTTSNQGTGTEYVNRLADNMANFPATSVHPIDLHALLNSLIMNMRAFLGSAKNVVNYDDAKLTTLSWCLRAAATALELPTIRARSKRPSRAWVFLDCKTHRWYREPRIVFRRLTFVHMAIESEVTHNN